MKLNQGSSALLAITLVIFVEEHHAQEATVAINRLRRELDLPKNYEFKFNNCRRRVIDAFMDMAMSLAFKYHTIIIQKKNLWSHNFKDRTFMLTRSLEWVFTNASEFLEDARVFYDEMGPRELAILIHDHLNFSLRNIENCRIHSLEFRDSRDDNLLQLADMVCGAVAKFFKMRKKTIYSPYPDKIIDKECGVQVWPK